MSSLCLSFFLPFPVFAHFECYSPSPRRRSLSCLSSVLKLVQLCVTPSQLLPPSLRHLYSLSRYIPPPYSSPVLLIAKSMLIVREQCVSGTASEHGYPLPPLPGNLCVYVHVCVFPPPPHANTHPSICPISTCAEVHAPGTLTNESLPRPSVAFLAGFTARTLPFIPMPVMQSYSVSTALSLVWLQLMCGNISFGVGQR